MNTKPLLLAGLLVAVALSGCASQDTRGQAGEVADLEELKRHHIFFECTVAIDGLDGGIHADLSGPCKGELKQGDEDDFSVTFNGHNDNLGTYRFNRESTISVFSVDADGKNSATTTVVYNVETNQQETATVTAKINTDSGFGGYDLCFEFNGYRDSNSWLPGTQEDPDPTQPLPKCVGFKASKEGLF